ncbi:MAG: pyrrolidone-carboxylate peptidase [Verrucomicrobiales bacterium]|nr:pyrrolidone-carboxylate peptidase [Verrucomicrobiales bacterium]
MNPFPTLLLTGFEPFGGDAFNPSGELAKGLHGMEFSCGMRVRGQVLPVSGEAAWSRMAAAVRRYRPQWVVAMGVSGRAEISLETTAWNEADFRIPDNKGWQPRGVPVLRRGPPHYQVDWPGVTAGLGDGGSGVEGIWAGEAGAGPVAAGSLPVRASTDPGRFVCNFLYYRLLHLTRNPMHPAHGRALFVHLPATAEMRRAGKESRYYHSMNNLQDRVRELLQTWTRRSGGPSE